MSWWQQGAGGFLGKATEFAEKAKAAAAQAAEQVSTAAAQAAEQAQASDFLEKAKNAANTAADAVSKAAEQAQAEALKVQALAESELRRNFLEGDCQVFEVRPELIVIEFPSEDKITDLSSRLNRDHAQRMLIYNMSERKYDTSCFSGEIVDVAFRGLPAPPLMLLMELCLSAHHWLASDAKNVLVVHCFMGFSRSAVFLSCFLAFRGLYAHPVDALHEVCKSLGIDDENSVLPSQRRYLTYFQQCQQGMMPSLSRLRFLRASLNGVPRLESEGTVAMFPYIEVWNHGELVHSSFTGRPKAEGASADSASGGDSNWPAAVNVDEPCVHFQLPSTVTITGDVLVRLRHVRRDGSRETACRLAFNTAFVPEGLQLAKHELDGAADDARFPEESFMDLVFEPVADKEGSESSAAPTVFKKAFEVAKRLRQEEEKRREEERRRQEEEQRRLERERARVEASAKGPDEGDELEETLRRASMGGSRKGGANNAAAGDATDLLAALAEAAADDKKAAADDTAAAPAAAGTPAPGAKIVEDLVKDSDNDIDALFSEFDAALASVGTAAPATVESDAAPAPAAAEATKASAPEPAAVAATATPAADDAPAAPTTTGASAAPEAPAAPAASAAPAEPAAPAAAPSAPAPAEAPAASTTAAAAGYPSAAAVPVAPAAPVEAAAPAAPAAAAAPASAEAKAPASTAGATSGSGAGTAKKEDIFADMDAFLAELEVPSK